MINAIINGIFSLIISLVNLILSPINLLINNYLPSLDNALDIISDFFDTISDVFPWVISYTGFNSTTISILIGLGTFALTVPLLVKTIKLAIKWYNSLKI